MTSVTLNVPDISCEHCQRAITCALAPLAGVADMSVDIPAKQVHLTYDSGLVDIECVEAVLAEEDYPSLHVPDPSALPQRGRSVARDLPLHFACKTPTFVVPGS